MEIRLDDSDAAYMPSSGFPSSFTYPTPTPYTPACADPTLTASPSLVAATHAMETRRRPRHRDLSYPLFKPRHRRSRWRELVRVSDIVLVVAVLGRDDSRHVASNV